LATVRWGQAKREVAALWPLISLRLAETTIRQIYLGLRASGQVTVTEKNFYAQVNARLKADKSLTDSATTGRDLVAGAARPSVPVTVPVKQSNAANPPPEIIGEVGPTAAFVHNAQSDLDEQW
jgi:hypothetical protein